MPHSPETEDLYKFDSCHTLITAGRGESLVDLTGSAADAMKIRAHCKQGKRAADRHDPSRSLELKEESNR